MRPTALLALVVFVCGCGSEKERFDRDMMHRYEVECAKYYAIYDSGDIERAKKALRDIVAFSVAERDRAKFYWRFNLMAAYAQARLAVIAESQGNKQEAQRLFGSASKYMALQKTMLAQHLQEMPNVQWAEADTIATETPTPDQWRKGIAALDAHNHVRWKSLNPQGGANGRQPFGSETNQTPAAAASRRSP
jgi:hypothetical protein